MPKVSEQDLVLRRRDILEGARSCFAEFGYDGATVARLEAATGKSRGAIFHHFGSKEELFLALAREDAEQMAEVTAAAGLVEVMRDVLAHPERHSWLGTRLEIVRRLRTDEVFRAHWLDHQSELDDAVLVRLEASRAAGTLRDDVPTETVKLLLELMLDGIMTRLASGRPTDGIGDVLDLLEQAVRYPGA